MNIDYEDDEATISFPWGEVWIGLHPEGKVTVTVRKTDKPDQVVIEIDEKSGDILAIEHRPN